MADDTPQEQTALEPVTAVTPEVLAPVPEGRFAVRPWVLWTIVVGSAIYLGNFTMGVDILPDNLPLVGNLDEVVALLLGQQAWVALRTGSSRLFRLLP